MCGRTRLQESAATMLTFEANCTTFERRTSRHCRRDEEEVGEKTMMMKGCTYNDSEDRDTYSAAT